MAEFDIQVQIDEQFAGRLSADWLERVAREALLAEDVAAPAEVSLTVTDPETVRRLNREYRGFDEPTDVLAFAQGESRDEELPFVQAPDGIHRLGDVVISYPQAAAQAEQRGAPVERELALLTVHGLLHLLGYDHGTSEEEAAMRARENAALGRIFPVNAAPQDS